MEGLGHSTRRKALSSSLHSDHAKTHQPSPKLLEQRQRSITMKLLLDPSVVDAVSSRVGASSGDVNRDVHAILSTFREVGHTQFTRPDVSAILYSMGYTGIEDGRLWSDIGRSIKSFSVKVSHGYWACDDARLSTQLEIAAPAKAPVKAKLAEKSTGPTVTAKWFEEQMREKALDRRVASMLRRKNPNDSWESILSLVHLWFAKWSATGHCDEHILAGKPPSSSVLAIWVEHKKTHSVYHDGKDALMRHIKGARTQFEIRNRRESGGEDFMHPESQFPSPDIRAVEHRTNNDKETVSSHGFRLDFTSMEESDPLEATFREEELSLVRDVVRVCRARAGDRYVRFFDHMINGLTREEVAEAEGVSELRVSHLLQRVRDDMKAAPDLIRVCLKVLSTISEEPWSTEEEIQDEVASDEEMTKNALRLLVLRKLAEEGRGNTFAPTDAGRHAVGLGQLV